jgi:predicted O-methyltransferase YrrM
MTEMISKVGWTVYRKAYGAARNGQQIAQLGAEPHPAARPISEAVRAVLTDDFTPEERAAFDRIEELRAALARSDEEITTVDYGAGESTDTRTAEEMARGRTATTTVGAICRSASKPPRWGRLLFALVRRLEPKQALELGSSLGLSAAYQASALQLNGSGQLDTLEGAPTIAERARVNLQQLSLPAEVTVGRFQDTLGPLLEERPVIDYAFVDGHHDRDATITYFQQLAPHVSEGGVLVFDDVAWSPGMAEAWSRIRSDARVGIAVDLFKIGICGLGGTSGRARTYRVALD